MFFCRIALLMCTVIALQVAALFGGTGRDMGSILYDAQEDSDELNAMYVLQGSGRSKKKVLLSSVFDKPKVGGHRRP